MKSNLNLPEMERSMKAIVDEAARAFHVPSVCVGVSLGGKDLFYTAGRRSILGGPVNKDTVYPIASVTKSFTAASVMMLVEEGKLDLDKPMASYLPDFQMFTPELTAALTIRDALCHRSGLPRHDVTLILCEDIVLAEAVRRIRYLEPAWAPRERFHYQNHLFAAASLLVEKVSGLPWGGFVKKRIFDPLGMSRSYAKSQEYEGVDNNYGRPLARVGPLNIPIPNLRSDNVGGAGAISASVRDLLQWSKTNLARGLSPGGQRIFSETSAGELHAPQMPIRKGEFSPFEVPGISETSYGFGWFLEKFYGAPLLFHGGNLMGFSSLAGFLPEQDFAFAILVNQSGSPAPSSIGYGLCEKVLGIMPPCNWNHFYAEAMTDMARKAKQKYHDALKAPAVKPDIRGCAGVYENPAYGRVFVESGLGGLVLRLPNKKLKVRIRPGTGGEMVIASKLMGAAAFPCRFCREDGVVNAIAFEARLEEEAPSYSRFVRVADR